MSERKLPTVPAALGLGHFLFLSSLFWSAGIHRGAVEAFLAAPLWVAPALSQTAAQGALYILGLLSLGVLVGGWKEKSPSWTNPALIILLVAELHLVALDLHLAGRFWFLLLVLTLLWVFARETGALVGFWAIPASGPWGAATLFFLLPLFWERPSRKMLAGSGLLLFAQGHLDTNLDLTIFAWFLLLTLFWDGQIVERKACIGAAFAIVLSVVMFWGSWSPLQVTISFAKESRSHTLSILRIGKTVRLVADGEELAGPWYLNGHLVANPLFFTAQPRRLNSPLLYRSYGRQLQERWGVDDFGFEIDTAGRAPESEKM